MQDALNWFRHVVQQLSLDGCLEQVTAGLHSAAHELQISTAFSGIGAAEVAFETIIGGLAKTRQQPCEIKNFFAVEWLPESQLELQCLPHPPEHLYSDMCHFISPKISDFLEQNVERLEFPDLLQVAKHNNFCCKQAPCLLHGRFCESARADVHIAGTPCVDFSNIGSRKGVTGKALLPFLTWVAHRRQLQEAAILHENVPTFPIELLKANLSDLYCIQSAVVSASALGHACDRQRRFTWMLHKRFVIIHPGRAWSTDVERFHRESTLTWQAYLVASEEEKMWEIAELVASHHSKESKDFRKLKLKVLGCFCCFKESLMQTLGKETQKAVFRSNA